MGVDFSGITIPFSASDLLSSGVGLLGVVGGFVLLAMAFPVAGRLVTAIKRAFGNNSGKY